MNKVFLLILFIAGASLYASAQFKSGLLLSGGKGSIHNLKLPSDIINKSERPFHITKSYKLDIALGYKFRIQPPAKRYFYDIDMHFGIKSFDFEYTNTVYSYQDIMDGNWADPNTSYATSVGQMNGYFSVNPSWNYRIVKGLHAGAGIEPALCYIEFTDLKFDSPVTGRIGYDFRFVDIALIYKAGLFHTTSPKYTSSGRLDSWQVQLFIPF